MCDCLRVYGQGILWHFSRPNPFLLNEICLNKVGVKVESVYIIS